MMLSVQIQLKPSQEQAKALKDTVATANKAANYASEIAWKNKTFGQYHLHNLTYFGLRENFGLMAQMAVRVVAKVADGYKLDKKTQRVFREDGAIAFDERILRLKTANQTASIATLSGRIKVPYLCGERQRKLLENRHGEADLVCRKGKWYLFVSVQVEVPPPELFDKSLGVDLGITNLAVDSSGHFYSGEQTRKTRTRYKRLRQKLQRAGTKFAKKHLKKISKKESLFQRNINHTISKRIVQTAKGTSRRIALEDLTGIRERTTVQKSRRYLHLSWAFAQLRQYISYKAELSGIPVVLVDPRYTSQRCPCCGHIAKGNRKTQSDFVCLACHTAGHADFFAARNIAHRADVNQPTEGSMYALVA